MNTYRVHWLLKSVLIAGILCSTSSEVSAEGLSKEEKSAGFVSMFNGKDFTGWRFSKGAAPDTVSNWMVKDGVIHLTGGGRPHLGTTKAYADFEMKFEWRTTREKGKYNSGFYIRSGKDVGKNQINLAQGSEGKFLGKLEGSKAVSELQKPNGEWNEWQVRVVGDKVTFTCNGKPAWEASGLMPAQGHIGFQAEGAPMEFRHLRIREIK